MDVNRPAQRLKTNRWRVILVLVAFITIFVGGWFWPAIEPLQRRPFEAARSAPAPIVIDVCKVRAKTQPSAAAANDTYVKCISMAEERRLVTNDLIQQTRAADAASAQATVASAGLNVAWLQAVGGLLTLFAAVAAVWHARNAAIHAQRSAEAAHFGNRPFLKLSILSTGPLSFDPTSARLSAQIQIENVGASPALDVHVQTFMIADEMYHEDGLGNGAEMLYDAMIGRVEWNKTRGVVVFPARHIIGQFEFKDGALALRRPRSVFVNVTVACRYRVGSKWGFTSTTFVVVPAGTAHGAIDVSVQSHPIALISAMVDRAN